MSDAKIKGTVPGFYSRPQAHRIIGSALGLAEESNDWHKIYRRLGIFFNDDTINKRPIGDGGETQRLVQVYKDDLFEFAKREYGVEVSEWKPQIHVENERLSDIEKLLELRDKGVIEDGGFIDGVRKILLV